jgi:uncharacterized protein YlbG (UPF0298 family)
MVTLASYKWIVSQKKKSFSDGEFVKEMICTVMKTLQENYEMKMNTASHTKFKIFN